MVGGRNWPPASRQRENTFAKPSLADSVAQVQFSEATTFTRIPIRALSSASRVSSTASGGRLSASPDGSSNDDSFRIAARFDMDTERDAFVSSLAKFTYLTTIKAG